LLLNLD